MRIGLGYDVHRLAIGRKLIIGGVHIPYDMGLLGHSDADVLIHALIDGILGAAGLGDIGEYFPDSDDKYKDADSIVLLEETLNMIKNRFVINNVDCIIVAEKPKLSSYKNEIKEKLSKVLNIDIESIGIKAKTQEGLGFTGRKEGIAAYAIVSLLEMGIDINT